MVFPPVFLIHQCAIIQHRAVSTNEYGETVYADTVLPERRCRFFPVTEASADRTVYSAKLVLERTEDIQQNDIVESSDPGFARRYWVNSVRRSMKRPVVSRIPQPYCRKRNTWRNNYDNDP